MAITSVGELIIANDKTEGGSISAAATANASADDVCILVLATDNESTSDGNTSEHSTVTDSAGNTWTKLLEYCSSGGAAQSNVNAGGEFQILTGTGATSDPTQVYGLSIHQQSDIFLALEEVSEGGGGTTRQQQMLLGVGS